MILVTGAAGFIGCSFVLDWLREVGEPVVSLDKLTYAGNLRNLAAPERDARPVFVRGDVGDRSARDALLAKHRPRAIAPGVLAEQAHRLDAVLVHYSTDYVFDGTKPEPHVESDPPNPLSVYGRTKLEGERAIGASGCRHLTLRTSWVYGARGQNFLLTMLRLAGERRRLRVVHDQVGAPTWSREIALATAALLARPELAQPGAEGIYHLTASGSTSWCGFARTIFASPEMARLGVTPPAVEAIASSEYALPARRPANSRLDCGRLFSRAGVRLEAWDAALARCLAEVPTARPA